MPFLLLLSPISLKFSDKFVYFYFYTTKFVTFGFLFLRHL